MGTGIDAPTCKVRFLSQEETLGLESTPDGTQNRRVHPWIDVNQQVSEMNEVERRLRQFIPKNVVLPTPRTPPYQGDGC